MEHSHDYVFGECRHFVDKSTIPPWMEQIKRLLLDMFCQQVQFNPPAVSFYELLRKTKFSSTMTRISPSNTCVLRYLRFFQGNPQPYQMTVRVRPPEM